MLKAVQHKDYAHFLMDAVNEEKKNPSEPVPGRPYAGMRNVSCGLMGDF